MGVTNTATTSLSTLLSNGGLGTGLNVTELVAEAIQADSAPLTLIEDQQTQLSAETAALTNISDDLFTLQNAVNNLTDLTGALSSEQAVSSDSTILTATASTTAQQATHNIVVNSLATTSTYYTNPATLPATGDTALATGGTFTITAGGQSASITIDSSNNTLTELASAINSSAVGGAVTATVIQDSSGARLAVVSNTSGSAGDFTISDPGNSTGLDFTKPITGTDASLTVDGVPITSSSDIVTGAIPGVTLDLAGANPNETVSLGVQADDSQVISAVNQFVTAYNQVISDLNAQTNVNSTTGSTGVLASDSTISFVQDALFNAINYTGSGSISSLASLGVSVQDDGTLQLDTATLTNALNGNFSAVQNFFQSASSGAGQALTAALSNLTDPTQGPVALDLQGIAQTQTDLTNQVNDIDTNLLQEQQTLTDKYSAVNVVLQELPVLQQQISSQLAGL